MGKPLTESELARTGREYLWMRIVSDYVGYRDMCTPSNYEPPEPWQHLSTLASREHATRNLAPRLVEIGRLPRDILQKPWEEVELAVGKLLGPEYTEFQRDKRENLRSRGISL